MLLNLHVDPGPNLKIDGNFGTKTLAALKKYQTAQNLRVDGVVGKATWHRLMYPSKVTRIVQPNAPADVSVWPMPKRIAEVIRLLPSKLPLELWSQLKGLMSTDLMVLAVGLYAASHAFGVGELIDIGILLIVGEQGLFELAECVQITVLAMSPKDLDEAATHLARAISIITVYKFVSLLASLLTNRPAGASESPAKSTSQTAAPASGETTGTAPRRSGGTSTTGPPRSEVPSGPTEEGGESVTENAPEGTPPPRAIPVSAQRRTHILDGDATGGGHGPGRQIPGKSEFPPSLSDNQIIEGVERIANDPNSYPSGVVPTGPGRFAAVGEINGVPTRVIVEPGGEGVITAWPIGVPRNP